ncbi:MAG: MoaD/ThiS family protein [Xanthomonadales bacterium]|nr:MoaD/ThiS family protein [Xanthomonadales bacterium]
MIVQVSLFGAFRQFDPAAQVTLTMPEAATVADLRRALGTYAESHWPEFKPGLLARSAFASDREVLRDGDALPADGRMAVLPPVSGG